MKGPRVRGEVATGALRSEPMSVGDSQFEENVGDIIDSSSQWTTTCDDKVSPRVTVLYLAVLPPTQVSATCGRKVQEHLRSDKKCSKPKRNGKKASGVSEKHTRRWLSADGLSTQRTNHWRQAFDVRLTHTRKHTHVVQYWSCKLYQYTGCWNGMRSKRPNV